METAQANPSNDFQDPPAPLRELLIDAARFWEPRRIPYNLALLATVFTWLVATWPHFRSALTLSTLGVLTVLGLIANLFYSVAYLIDVVLQTASFRSVWRRRRWALWLTGLIFAIVLTNYWIVDEIYPYVSPQ
jgi:hypothetical protein